ncbi:MAG: type II secretion system GspH family protein [Meiothermus sp.]|uniref:type II secretion system protein n=1 Tax=Meiothermus sp. TaxID=1955249 RepID=UPI0025FC3E5B|nr:type II secretion system protein [Meiothermus sp.]MCS7069495.1 type II secretion system GspH family protein [Meiothermus sp.]
MRKPSGISIVELLVALAIIGIAFVPLVLSQLSSLRASAQTGLASQVKAAATAELERQAALVLQVESPPSNNNLLDDISANKSFYFVDYYYSCPQVTALPSPPPSNSSRTALRSGISCNNGSGTTTNLITTRWSVARESGLMGEGLITITVTATHSRGPTITLVNRISCYDVYPSPTSDAPAPCPTPSGGP